MGTPIQRASQVVMPPAIGEGVEGDVDAVVVVEVGEVPGSADEG